MAFGELGIAKTIITNAPKYKRIVEPFGDGGTLALYAAKKKPKEHKLNIVDENIFTIMSFLQSFTPADKKTLKKFDWVGSLETFDSAVAITAVDGPEYFYRFFYLKQFSMKQKDPEAAPVFDLLMNGHDMSPILRSLPIQRSALKKITITNEDPMSLISGSGGSDTLLVLLPQSPEQIEAVEAKLSGISASFFFAKKSKSNEELFSDAAKYDSLTVSTFAASSIMMATMEVLTNFETKLLDIKALQEETGVKQ